MNNCNSIWRFLKYTLRGLGYEEIYFSQVSDCCMKIELPKHPETPDFYTIRMWWLIDIYDNEITFAAERQSKSVSGENEAGMIAFCKRWNEKYGAEMAVYDRKGGDLCLHDRRKLPDKAEYMNELGLCSRIWAVLSEEFFDAAQKEFSWSPLL